MREIVNDAKLDSSYQTFKAIVSYKLIDNDGCILINNKKRRVVCEFNNRKYVAPDEINLLSGLTYNDLSEDVKKQILINKLKELIKIDLKLMQHKWSTWEEVPIEIDEG